MAERTVTIRISAQDSFSSVFKQYQQAIGQAADDTKQFDKATSGSGKGVDSLTSAIGDAVKGFIAFKAVGAVADMVRLGQAANATQATFTALSGGAAEAANALQLMRTATGGIVADTELMAGANRLLAMHIANTSQQAADLAGVAVNLGRAFGQDAASAIENFSLMIANQSLLRLDSLGISASAVRARMAELADEFPNMDKQARFTQATLEEATKTVDRLGDSITAAQTPLSKLETRFENFKTNVGQSIADTVNNAITSFEQLGTIMSVEWQNFTNQHPGAGNTAGQTLVGNHLVDFQNSQYAAARQQMAAQQQQSELMRFQSYSGNLNAARIQQQRQLRDLIIMSQMRDMSGAGSNSMPFMAAGFGINSGMNLAANTITGTQYANDKLFQYQHNADEMKMGKFLDPSAFDEIKARFEELQRLNEQGLISDESLAKAEAFKDQAEAAANAFKNMSLTDIFGQSSGGMQGQIGDMVIAEMRKNGAKPEEIANAQRMFDLGSGRETDASLAMKEKVAPMIAQLPAEEQAKAIENLNNFLEWAAKLNMTPDKIANLLPGATGIMGGGMGSQFTVTPYSGTNNLAPGSNDPKAFAAWYKKTYGVDAPASLLSSIGGVGVSTTVTAEDVRPQIESAMANQLLGQYNKGGFNVVSKDEILKDPSFQAAVNEAVAQTVAKANSPVGAAGGVSTVSDVVAWYKSQGINVSEQQVMSAAGISNPMNLQPGTYNLGGNMVNPSFNPQAYAMGYNVPMGGAPGANPFVSTGLAGAGLFPDTGQNAGAADPAQKMADMKNASDEVVTNVQQMNTQMEDLATKGDAFTKVLDEAAKARDMTFTVNLKDNTNGFLSLLLNSQQFGTLTMLQSNGLGVRDGGGNASQLGTVSTASSRPGFSQRP